MYFVTIGFYLPLNSCALHYILKARFAIQLRQCFIFVGYPHNIPLAPLGLAVTYCGPLSLCQFGILLHQALDLHAGDARHRQRVYGQ